jgi:hypothetical protein
VQIPGHLAVALLQERLLLPNEAKASTLALLLIASLFPDVVDKSIGYIFRVMPNGRHYSHNVFSLLLVSGVVTLLGGQRAGYAWFIGHLGHLVADYGSPMPWFFPLKRYPFKQGHLKFNLARIRHEALALSLVLLVRWLLTR